MNAIERVVLIMLALAIAFEAGHVTALRPARGSKESRESRQSAPRPHAQQRFIF